MARSRKQRNTAKDNKALKAFYSDNQKNYPKGETAPWNQDSYLTDRDCLNEIPNGAKDSYFRELFSVTEIPDLSDYLNPACY